MPLVFNFHGYGSNAVEQMAYADFRPQAEKNDFLIVAPDGQDGGGRHFVQRGRRPPERRHDGRCAAEAIEATLCVDAARVYSTGMSDGGAMTSVLACTLPTSSPRSPRSP